jgi:hypothetical protein
MDKDTPKNNWRQKPLGPVWAIALGILVLGISIALLVFLIHTIKSGETWKFNRHHPGLVSREKSPVSFWMSACFSSVFTLVLGYSGFAMLGDGFRGLQKCL